MTDAPSGPLVERGHVTYYRLFDVADSIDLDRAARLVQRGDTRRLDIHRRSKGQIRMAAPPLSFSMGQHRLQIDQQEHALECELRVFDFGVLSVALRLTLAPGTTLEGIVELNAGLSEHATLERFARDQGLWAFDQLRDAMTRPARSGFVEDYTVTYIEAFAEPPTPAMLAAHPALPRLLMQENSPRGVSRDAAEDALSTQFSYYADELAVVDWNSALIYDPTGDPDMADLLEFGSAQLLELRYYDDLLDRELSRMYDEIERVRGFNRKRQYRALTRRLMQVVLEVTELTEKIDNSLKWTGDLYLARFYQGAAKQFNLSRWQGQVERKLALVSRVTELLSDQISTDQALRLESSIVLLIVFEILLAFFHR